MEQASLRVGERARRGVLGRGLRTVAELNAVVVDSGHRRAGVGTSLVREVCRVYAAAGYSELVGQFPNRRPVTAFASRSGLNVLSPGAALDLTAVLGVPAVLRPTPGCRVAHAYRG